MAKDRKASDHVDPRDEVLVKGVLIRELLYDHREMPYFEMTWDLATVKVRIYHGSHEWIKWIEAHLGEPMDVVIFPFQWAVGNKSGVVNYFRSATLS